MTPVVFFLGRERDAGRREQDPHEKLPHLTFISSPDERKSERERARLNLLVKGY